MYRMTATLAPYATHPDLPQFHGQVEECADELARGRRAARASSTSGCRRHPGQYIVLNSEDAGGRGRRAVRDLEVQAALLDAMGCGPEAVVVLHVGGAAGGATRSGASRRGFERLSDARARRGW